MKKFTACLLVLAVMLSFAGCGEAKELTAHHQILDLKTGKILTVDGSQTKSDIESILGEGTLVAENDYDYRGGEIGVVYRGEIPYIIGVKNIDNYKIYGYELGLSVEEMSKVLTPDNLDETGETYLFSADYDAEGNAIELYDEAEVRYSVLFVYLDGEFAQVMVINTEASNKVYEENKK